MRAKFYKRRFLLYKIPPKFQQVCRQDLRSHSATRFTFSPLCRVGGADLSHVVSLPGPAVSAAVRALCDAACAAGGSSAAKLSGHIRCCQAKQRVMKWPSSTPTKGLSRDQATCRAMLRDSLGSKARLLRPSLF